MLLPILSSLNTTVSLGRQHTALVEWVQWVSSSPGLEDGAASRKSGRSTEQKSRLDVCSHSVIDLLCGRTQVIPLLQASVPLWKSAIHNNTDLTGLTQDSSEKLDVKGLHKL